jgi:hypothetical protein
MHLISVENPADDEFSENPPVAIASPLIKAFGMRLVLAKGRSQYGSLRLHIDQLAAALAALGHETQVLDLLAEDRHTQLSEALSTRPDAFFTFNSMAHEVATGPVMREIGCVFASLHVDHPVHDLARLEPGSAQRVLFFLDRTHVDFVRAWTQPGAFAHLGFMPPGANELDTPVDVSDEAFARRDIPLLFTGTYRGAPTPGWIEWPETPVRELVVATAERMAADGQLALLDALRGTLVERRMSLSADLLRLIAPLLSTAQLYAEAHHRHAVLAALGESGVPIEAHGAGWEPMCARYPSIRHGGVGSFEETLGLLRRARLVLNINNGFVAGGHERVFTALCAGAAVVSDTSRFYADAFKDGEELTTYSLRQLDRAPGRLISLMSDLPAQAALARAGHRRAMAEHRWGARAAELIRAIEAVQTA